MRSRNTYSMHDQNPIFLNSCNSDVLFPANSKSFRKIACIVNCTVFHRLTIVTQSRVIYQQLLGRHVFFTSYSWYVFLLIAYDRRYLPIHAACPLCATFQRMKTQCYHNWPPVECLQSSAQHSYTCTKHLGVNAFNKSVMQDYVHNSRTCDLQCPLQSAFTCAVLF